MGRRPNPVDPKDTVNLYSVDAEFREDDEPLFSLRRVVRAPKAHDRVMSEDIILTDLTAGDMHRIISVMTQELADCARELRQED